MSIKNFREPMQQQTPGDVTESKEIPKSNASASRYQFTPDYTDRNRVFMVDTQNDANCLSIPHDYYRMLVVESSIFNMDDVARIMRLPSVPFSYMTRVYKGHQYMFDYNGPDYTYSVKVKINDVCQTVYVRAEVILAMIDAELQGRAGFEAFVRVFMKPLK